jgi:hypothetical protein
MRVRKTAGDAVAGELIDATIGCGLRLLRWRNQFNYRVKVSAEQSYSAVEIFRASIFG